MSYGNMDPKLTQKYGRILLRSIENDLAGVDFFTREDLLHLPTFDHVATITRYRIICEVMSHLLDQGKIVARNRTELCLPRNRNKQSDEPFYAAYSDTIEKLVTKFKVPFGVMDVVAVWKTDPQLTENNKRVAVRHALTRLLRENTIVRSDDFKFKVQ